MAVYMYIYVPFCINNKKTEVCILYLYNEYTYEKDKHN